LKRADSLSKQKNYDYYVKIWSCINGGKNMIVYYKLANILKERNLQWKDLCDSGISINTPTRFSQNKSISSDTIDKVCSYLHVQPGDIMEWVENENELKKREIQSQIEALQKQLSEM
jgi:DNA-binding Xre family transcriptional regulator